MIIDGRAQAETIRTLLKKEIAEKNITATLAVILVGDNPASQIYVAHKKKACEQVGITSIIHHLEKDSTAKDIIELINTLNNDETISGILLQLPLPAHLDALEILNHIAPHKDVDGLTITNMGHLISGTPNITPCTPQGVLDLIKSCDMPLAGKNVIIIGRSLLFGKPMGQLLLNEDCTVTQCHSKTQNLPQICAQADILICAVGVPKMVRSDWVKPGAIVIDVGISHDENNTLSGDVDFENVKEKASAITPVPGGVGPMTIACLLRNTVQAAKKA